MPAPDIYHNAVKNALIKDGWTITTDPYKIKHINKLEQYKSAIKQILTEYHDWVSGSANLCNFYVKLSKINNF